jgi:hypothetical protein
MINGFLIDIVNENNEDVTLSFFTNEKMYFDETFSSSLLSSSSSSISSSVVQLPDFVLRLVILESELLKLISATGLEKAANDNIAVSTIVQAKNSLINAVCIFY